MMMKDRGRGVRESIRPCGSQPAMVGTRSRCQGPQLLGQVSPSRCAVKVPGPSWPSKCPFNSSPKGDSQDALGCRSPESVLSRAFALYQGHKRDP